MTKQKKDKKIELSKSEKIAKILVDFYGFSNNKIEKLMEMINEVSFELDFNEKLPEDCHDICSKIMTIVDVCNSDVFLRMNPDKLIYTMNKLSGLRVYLGELEALYTSKADNSLLHRRVIKASQFTALRSLGLDFYENIKNKTTIEDTKQLTEVFSIFQLEPQIYIAYVARHLQNLLRTSKELLTSIDRRLTELKYQRTNEGEKQSY